RMIDSIVAVYRNPTLSLDTARVSLPVNFTVPTGDVCELIIASCPENYDGDTITVSNSTMALATDIFACTRTRTTDEAVLTGTPFRLSVNGNPAYGEGNIFKLPEPLPLQPGITSIHIETEYHFRETNTGDIVDTTISNNTFYIHRVNSADIPNGFDLHCRNFPQMSIRHKGNIVNEVSELYDTLEVHFVPGSVINDSLEIELTNVLGSKDHEVVTMSLQSDGTWVGTFVRQLDDTATLEDGVLQHRLNDSLIALYRNPKIPLETVRVSVPVSIMGSGDLCELIIATSPKSYNGDTIVVPSSVVAFSTAIITSNLGNSGSSKDLTPKIISVNGEDARNIGGGMFKLAEPYPLMPELTRLEIDLHYLYKDAVTGHDQDTIISTHLYVLRSDEEELPVGFNMNCWNRSDLTLRYQGTEINTIIDDMDTLELHLSPINIRHDSVIIDVVNSKSDYDSETFDLSELDDDNWSTFFTREIDPKPTQNDGVFQHTPKDSLIAVYRNPKIPLDTIRISIPINTNRLISVKNAAYYDNSGDGFVDSVFIKLDYPLSSKEAELFASWLVLPSHRDLVIDSVFYREGGIALNINEQGSTFPVTAVTDEDFIIVNEGIFKEGGYFKTDTVNVTDKIAPVIIDIALSMMGENEDTLTVTFSENVTESFCNNPISFSTAEGEKYSFNLRVQKIKGETVKFIVEDIGNGIDLVSKNDTAWINSNSCVFDLEGNIQDNPFNRRAALNLRLPSYGIETIALNNPFNPDKSHIDPFFRSFFHSSENVGLILVAKPDRNIRHAKLYGTVSIYDVVKNPIILDKPLVFDENEKSLYFLWNGRNSRGREVASGTYMAVMEIKDNYGLNEKVLIRIGVNK
ncbi:hypothetical protein QA601_18550, partial [Chitinispirillales bacterium ANBcel5]|uniref:hypothetical protein n=1 Tax=Cellulosispirillum alkaliphilum TaxID=3039283 RepID=UPI002A4FEEE4|nr:hypothetical protein [Chitinispirillales bacterium ANBcel5]